MSEAAKHAPGLSVIDAKYVHSDLSNLWVTASGYADDEASVNDAKALFNIYAAAPEMLDFIKQFRQAKEKGREDEEWLVDLADRILDKAEGRGEG